MQSGYLRFTKQLDIISHIINKATKSENPIAYIYQNDLRTPFFMLEGLCRMYREIHNGKTFRKILAQAKAVEDTLGKYDFYVVLHQDVANNELLPEKLKEHIAKERDNVEKELNELLTKEEWWNGNRLSNWSEKLRKLKWLKEKKEIEALVKVYDSEIRKVYSFVEKAPFPFEDMEEHVHELRRKLRWLSIYCHSLDGVVELKDVYETIPGHYQKYFTERIINSPFNQFVSSYRYKYHLQINKSSFLALSWMIATIGDLKDEGLSLHAIHDIAKELKLNKNEQVAVQESLKDYEQKNAAILEQVSDLTTHFLAENVLNHLLV